MEWFQLVQLVKLYSCGIKNLGVKEPTPMLTIMERIAFHRFNLIIWKKRQIKNFQLKLSPQLCLLETYFM